jgi:hypothetical protein
MVRFPHLENKPSLGLHTALHGEVELIDYEKEIRHYL